MELKGKKILAVVAHPDDETIGCGGLLRKASEAGAICKVLLPVKRADLRGIENWNNLLLQFNEACRLFGSEAIIPPESVEDLTADQNTLLLNKIIQPYSDWADLILTHWRGDMHQAHQAVSKSVELLTRPFRTHKTVLSFEIPTSTDQAYINSFSPNLFVSISSDQMLLKKKAMSNYTSEQIAGRMPESLVTYMKMRGNQIGVEYAEAYQINRHFIL